MKRTVLCVFVLVIALSSGLWAGGKQEAGGTESLPEAKEMTLRMGLITNESHPVTMASRRFAEIVKDKSGGKITIQIIPGGSLGGEVEMHDMIASKTLDLGCFGSGIPSSYNPEFQILLMPYLWKDADTMIAFSKSDIMAEMNEKYTAKSKVRVLASNWNQGVRVTLTKQMINAIEDFEGVKIRVPQLPSWVDMWKLVGANPTPIPFPEVYSALQQGVVDGVENPANGILTSSFFEQAKCLVRTNHVMYFNMVFINDDLFQNMSAEYQEIIRDAAIEAGDYQNQIVQNQLSETENKLKNEGVKFVDIDLVKMSEIMKPLYDKWQDQFGSEIREKIEAFQN